MLKKVLIGLAALVVLFLILVAIQPADFRIERSASIAAPPGVVFGQVNDFHNWEAWSPWAKLDPAAKNTFSGPSSGTGAMFAWAGNNEIGEGRMTLIESVANELIRIKLEFIKPFASTCDTQFAFKPDGESTRVTWTMAGQNNFMSKAFCLFVDMDKMIGADFERGLVLLNTAAQAAIKKE